jgi:hypothetical protein
VYYESQLASGRTLRILDGLLWVTGLEAIFDSGGREEFEKKLCDCLGPQTPAFPNWHSEPDRRRTQSKRESPRLDRSSVLPGLSKTRTLHPFWGNFRVGGDPAGTGQ